jgi:hypothetical protein
MPRPRNPQQHLQVHPQEDQLTHITNMTSYLKITNFEKLDINKVKNILHNHSDDILLTEIQYEADHILIPHTNPEILQALDWKILGLDTESYVQYPIPRQNIHKGVPIYISEDSYKNEFTPQATQIRRLTKDGRPLPTIELTFPDAITQLDDLYTTTRLGKTEIRKQISTSTGSIQCSTCLILKPRKNHTNCILTCSYCAQRGHTKHDCQYYKQGDTSNRLCATCGDDHEASNCPHYLNLKKTLLERRQAKAIKQLTAAAEAERAILEEQKLEHEANKPLKRKRMTDNQYDSIPSDDTTCPYCQRSFNPMALNQHIPRCSMNHQKQDKSLRQSTLTAYTNE